MFVFINGNVVFSFFNVTVPGVGHVKKKKKNGDPKLVPKVCGRNLIALCISYSVTRRHRLSDCPSIGDIKFVCLVEVVNLENLKHQVWNILTC